MNYVTNFFYRSSFFITSLLYVTTSFPVFAKNPTEQWIIIHGTFAKNSEWHKTTSNESQKLARILTRITDNNYQLHSFVWSGQNNQDARLKAADELLTFLAPITPPYHIVAHSHGANVVLLAAEKMFSERKDFSIDELFSLGVPVHQEWYPNAHHNIKRLYNLFSYGDMVQTVLTTFERTVPETAPHIHNIQVKINATCPRHGDLHDPLILINLPRLRKMIKKQGPFLLQIHTTENEISSAALELEQSREKDLEADRVFRNQIISLYGQTRHKKIPAIFLPSFYTLKDRFP